jgi:hypothetical protein
LDDHISVFVAANSIVCGKSKTNIRNLQTFFSIIQDNCM